MTTRSRSNEKTDPCACEAEESSPQRHYNRPGLPSLAYRRDAGELGTHRDFLQRMLLVLPREEVELPVPFGEPQNIVRPLRSLTTQDLNDPAVALLDAWSICADVLTFYQERIVNEGFLRTAVERVSVLMMARTIGYELDPGVAASTLVAFTVGDADGSPARVSLDSGTPISSVPAQDQLPQPFETIADLEARSDWNAIALKSTQTQVVAGADRIVLKGVNHRVTEGDPIIIVESQQSAQPNREDWDVRIVESIEVDRVAGVTELRLVRQVLETTGDVAPADYRVYLFEQRAQLFGANAPVWSDLDPSTQASSIADYSPSVTALAANPDGGQVISAGADHTLRLWSTNNGQMLRSFHDHTDRINDVAFESVAVNGRSHFASVGDDGWVKVWRTTRKDPVYERVSRHDRATSVAFVPGRTDWILAGYDDGMLRKWGRESGRRSALQSSQIHEEAITVIAPFALGGADYALTASEAGPPKLVDLSDLSELEVADLSSPHVLGITSLSISIDGGDVYVASASQDRRVGLSRLSQGDGGTWIWEPLDSKSDHLASVNSVAFLPDRTGLVSASSDRSLIVWHIQTKGRLADLSVHAIYDGATAAVRSIVPIPGARAGAVIAMSGSDDGEMALWGLEVPTTRPDLEEPPRDPQADRRQALMVLDGHRVLLGYDDWEGFSIVGQKTRISPHGDFFFDLDAVYPKVFEDSWCLLRQERNSELYRVASVSSEHRADFKLNGKVTRITLDHGINPMPLMRFDLRRASAFVQSTEVELNEVPIAEPLSGSTLELDAFVPGLLEGKELVVAGDYPRLRCEVKLDLTPLSGAQDVSLAPGDVVIALRMLESDEEQTIWLVRDREGLEGKLAVSPGQTVLARRDEDDETPSPEISEGVRIRSVRTTPTSTTIDIGEDTPLQWLYDRATVTVMANVVGATHGERVSREVLGSGRGEVGNQSFVLKKAPLTYVPSLTAGRPGSTLSMRVNQIAWKEVASLNGQESEAEVYTVRIDDDGAVRVTFGDGINGSRLPSGVENVVAEYRFGIGLGGEVGANSISLMTQRPLGLRAVTNPVGSSGSAEPEALDDARANAPTRVLTLERVVSLPDYENFARAFPGIAKAQSAELWLQGARQVHVTIAAEGNAQNFHEVTKDSGLYQSLLAALTQLRDPMQPFAIDSHVTLRFGLDLGLLVDSRYETEAVYAAVVGAIGDAFSFEQRRFAEEVAPSDILHVAHGVDGVLAADLNSLELVRRGDGTAGSQAQSGLGEVLIAQAARVEEGRIEPAELLVVDTNNIEVGPMTNAQV